MWNGSQWVPNTQKGSGLQPAQAPSSPGGPGSPQAIAQMMQLLQQQQQQRQAMQMPGSNIAQQPPANLMNPASLPQASAIPSTPPGGAPMPTASPAAMPSTGIPGSNLGLSGSGGVPMWLMQMLGMGGGV